MAYPQGSNCLTSRQVYREIKRERKYQKLRWGVPDVDGLREIQKDPEHYLLYMQCFLSKAIERISTENGSDGALEEIRKVTALGFACLEQNGCPSRELRNVENKRGT